MELTAKQKQCLDALESDLRRETALEYVRGGYDNGVKAYKLACKTLNKKVSKNPDTSSAEILNYPSVKAFLSSMREEIVKAAQIDATYVLKRLVQIDELDILDIVKDDMSGFKLLSEWPVSWRRSINALDMKRMVSSGDEEFESVVEKVKFPDKVKNLELIGRHIDVKAWDKEKDVVNVSNNIMPVPTADSIDGWEEAAKKQQDEILSRE